ncbi:MAG: recombinase family protein [Steroidobacteraceae bacterium]
MEAFDRISREAAFDAQNVVQNIVHAGITIITLMDSKEYSVQVLRSDPMALIYMILLFTRGHEESATKSKRVADAWRRKRADLVTGKVLTAKTPGWIRLDDKRVPRVIPARAKVVLKIFNLFLAGEGRTGVAVRLNKDQVPTFGGGKYWSTNYVTKCLTNRAVLGEFQPHREQHGETRRRVRIADGAPVKKYWPAIIDKPTFDKAQSRLGTMLGARVGQARGIKNVLAGLARCPLCGNLMARCCIRSDGKQGGPRLVCGRARLGAGCNYRSVSLALVEAALAAGAPTLTAGVPDTSAELRASLEAVSAKRADLLLSIEDMVTLLSNTPSKTVAQRIQASEIEAETLQADIARLNQQLLYGSARRIRDAVSRMTAALQWHASEPSDAAGVNVALRECFDRVVIDYDKRQLQMHWRHGQTTSLPY